MNCEIRVPENVGLVNNTSAVREVEMTRRMVVGALLFVVVWGCGRSEPVAAPDEEIVVAPTWRAVAEPDLTPAQQAQLERALAAKDEMATTLMGELKAELELGGPSGAVVVCRDMAPMISEDVADNYGLSIGRTSHRLRNPENLPPLWAEPAVDAVVETAGYMEGPAGELGVILPIRLAAPCLACHGPADGLDEEVRSALAESYPDDQAMGFAEGDLRGWFWVEVPADGS
jgi:Protein of unknown function (DUF3365)